MDLTEDRDSYSVQYEKEGKKDNDLAWLIDLTWLEWPEVIDAKKKRSGERERRERERRVTKSCEEKEKRLSYRLIFG